MGNPSIFTSLFFLWLYCISFVNVHTYAISCAFNEMEALTTFKRSLSDPSARLSSWNNGKNCCEWHGVTCNFISGKVTKIDLRNSLEFTNLISSSPYDDSLGGEISSSLLELEDLNYLDLSLNNFEGAPIPHFFGMLKNLRYLNLSSAYFGGQIPPHLGNLSNLRYLDLSYNQFLYDFGSNFKVGNLQWLSGLSSLEYLDVGQVDLSSLQSNWMHEINRLSSLLELHLSGCNIQSLDAKVGFVNLTSLRVFDLSSNGINSVFPLWLSNFTSLTRLELQDNNFNGTIPRDFANLKNLHYLDLSRLNNLRNRGDHMSSILRNLCKLQFLILSHYNNFGCMLEELLRSFSNCSYNSLEFLDLSANELVGEISNSLGSLQNLRHLDLSSNELWGSLPNSLGSLQNLRYLDLSSNKLWGSLPNSIGNLSLLQIMSISSNFLNGTIPLSFGQLSKLIQFSAYDNLWRSIITEAHLLNLTKLELLQISTKTNHALVFNVSGDWIPPFRLKNLQLRNCLVGPQFPVWLQVQTQLSGDVIISNAGISGSIPDNWICNMSSKITSLDLSNNLLEGHLSNLFASQNPNAVVRIHNNLSVDSIMKKYPNLFSLFLQHNLLIGPIPTNIGDLMPNLRMLYLSNNRLSGMIPSSIHKMSYLYELSLSDNQFSGKLFDYWGELKSLEVIDLANNNLYGKIPSSIGLLTNLENLILSNNRFDGEIPKSLQNCPLFSIDLSQNRLNGSLPMWIEDVAVLWLLNLRSNHFTGTIPRQWCYLSALRVFDVSNNNLSGEIPSCLNNWTNIAYNYLMSFQNYSEKTSLVMKGREFEYGANLNYVLIVDISSNKLNGTIPNEITNLLNLGTLNLSNNHLVGTIPVNIGAMQQLQTLDLSCNRLSGNIPTSLASLNFLTHLNLSFNNLTGSIPTGRQLQTLNDPSIYEGNPFLTIDPSHYVGNPFQTKSSSDKNTNKDVPNSTNKEDGKENEMEIFGFGFYISTTIGFPIGLNILFFTIFTSRSRRIMYFRFIDRVSYSILEGIGFVIISMRRMRGRFQ